MDDKVGRLQKHLSLIRTSAGWSAQQLGDRLDVSRQMVSHWETGRNQMTMMQYLAIRQVLEEEIRSGQKNGDTRMLEDVIRVLVDEPESFTDEERTRVLEDANLLAPSIATKKTSRKHASAIWAAVLAGVAIAVGTAVKTSLDDPSKDEPVKPD